MFRTAPRCAQPPDYRAPGEAARRAHAWQLISAFWIDTEYEPSELEGYARSLHELGYSIAQLEHIFYFEVAPVVHPNSLTPAGEWIAFDAQWLIERCSRLVDPPSFLRRAFVRFAPTRAIISYAAVDDWTAVKAHLRAFGAPP